MAEPIAEGWLTTTQAENLTGYSITYIRQLAMQGKVIAQKVGRDWLINQESLLIYKAQMDNLGDQRHNPWREDLADQKRGRRSARAIDQANKV